MIDLLTFSSTFLSSSICACLCLQNSGRRHLRVWRCLTSTFDNDENGPFHLRAKFRLKRLNRLWAIAF